MIARVESEDGRWIPWVFVAFFALVILVNATLVFFAFDSWTGLSVDNAYARGLAYNRTLAEARARDALGWRLDVEFRPEAEGRGHLAAILSDRSGAALSGAKVHARLIRPTHAGHDVEVPLADLGDGRYGAGIALSLSGQWELRLRATLNGHTTSVEQRIEVP
jgi:nitrogen fixation protein FixH